MTAVISNNNKIHKQLVYLVSGPNRSGKSRWAEYLMRNEINVTYIATFENRYEDLSWQSRIKAHKLRRPDNWNVIESPRDLSYTISELKNKNILIDSIGGFVFNNLSLDENEWLQSCNDLIQNIKAHQNIILLVLEETGWDIIPQNKSAILFRDRIGELSQALNRISTQSWLVVNGRAIDLTNVGIIIP